MLQCCGSAPYQNRRNIDHQETALGQHGMAGSEALRQEIKVRGIVNVFGAFGLGIEIRWRGGKQLGAVRRKLPQHCRQSPRITLSGTGANDMRAFSLLRLGCAAALTAPKRSCTIAEKALAELPGPLHLISPTGWLGLLAETKATRQHSSRSVHSATPIPPGQPDGPAVVPGAKSKPTGERRQLAVGR